MADFDYFSGSQQHRTLLQFAIAVRRQLDRWEPLVDEYASSRLRKEKPAGRLIWDAEIEHRLLLTSCGQLLKSIGKFDIDIEVDPIVAAELKEVRDVLEHWENNMQIFNVTPRPATPPRQSGRNYADRNPDRTPYSWMSWSMQTGGGESELTVRVTANVSARQVRELIDRVRDVVLEEAPSLARFLPDDWASID